MWKVYFSRYVNMLCGGNPNEMLSSRVHNEGWWLEVVIDSIFFWQHRHCERSARWERRHNAQEASNPQKKDEAVENPPHQDAVETVVQQLEEGVPAMSTASQQLRAFKNATSCAHCGKVIDQREAVRKQYYDGQPGLVSVEDFCSEGHHQLWYIDRLRSFDQR